MEKLLGNMQTVSGEVDEMNGSRHQVLKEVHAISESSENTVRSTEEVNPRAGEAAGVRGFASVGNRKIA